MRKFIFSFVLVIITLPAAAQKLKTVEGEYTYHAPENVTLEQAKMTALDRAKIQALADAFGTIVSQYNATSVENRNGHSETDFSSIGGSEVKGEWIETLGEPVYHVMYEGEMLVVSAKVKGRAREVVTASIDFKAHILRNGTEDKFESDAFREDDYLYLSFVSPVSGFLAVYLVDDDGQASCLLPYRNQANGIYSIEANHRYLFFNEREAPAAERALVDEYYMTCKRSVEHNRIYLIFSPHVFAKANDRFVNEGLPRQLPWEDFNKWLVKCRKFDKDMNVRVSTITIRR